MCSLLMRSGLLVSEVQHLEQGEESCQGPYALVLSQPGMLVQYLVRAQLSEPLYRHGHFAAGLRMHAPSNFHSGHDARKACFKLLFAGQIEIMARGSLSRHASPLPEPSGSACDVGCCVWRKQGEDLCARHCATR